MFPIKRARGVFFDRNTDKKRRVAYSRL